MPIYDYRCLECGQRSTQYYQTFSAAERDTPTCPKCKSSKLEKVVTRVSFHRSEESRLDDMADMSAFGGVDENDPRSVARWARQMGQSFGDDLGDDWDEVVDQMEAGEMPDDGGMDDGMGGMMGGMPGMMGGGMPGMMGGMGGDLGGFGDDDE